jgi:drug/metabolite transporter (DMT)-like permease
VSVPAAFLGVVAIWATTPLAIKWSSEGAGALFGVASRMVIGVLLCLALLALLRQPLRGHRAALLTYLAGGLGVWGAMTSTYWAAQFIPSGLISVLFGLSPVVTGVMAGWWLGERLMTPVRLLGLALGLAGLALIFGLSLGGGSEAAWGVAGILVAVHVHAASSVWVKRIGADLPALATTTGSLVVSVPLFVAAWALADGDWPSGVPAPAVWSIVYLGVFGSALGFILYYHVLRRMAASRVALITLITPVLALALGHFANGEPIGVREVAGTGIILTGLALYQWGERLATRSSPRDGA